MNTENDPLIPVRASEWAKLNQCAKDARWLPPKNPQMADCQQEPCSAVWDAAKALDVEYPGLVHLNPYDAECKYHGPRPVEEAVVDGLIEVGDSVIGHGGGQQYMLTLLFKGRRVRVWYLRWRSIRELPLPPMQDGDEVVGTGLPSWMDWYYLPNEQAERLPAQKL